MKIPLLILTLLLVSSCTYTSYRQGDKSLTRVSVFGNQSVGKVDLEKGVIEGYKSEQAEMVGVVVEKAIQAGLKR